MVCLVNVVCCRLNRCSLWIAGEKDPRRRGIITSMNMNYGVGCVLGAVVALVLTKLDIDMGYAFFGLAIMTVFPAVLVAMLPSPHSYFGRDEHQTLLSLRTPRAASRPCRAPLWAASSCTPSTSAEGKLQSRHVRLQEQLYYSAGDHLRHGAVRNPAWTRRLLVRLHRYRTNRGRQVGRQRRIV